jgi:Rod binding domain-containing protein
MTISNLPQGFRFAPAGVQVDAASAAREFEALLIAQLLKTARQAGEALSEQSKQTGVEGYLELAEEHIARVMAQRGAFGISQLVTKGLDQTGERLGEPTGGPAGDAASRPAGGHTRLRGPDSAADPRVFEPQGPTSR